MRYMMRHRKPSYYIQNLHDELNRVIQDVFGEDVINELQTPETIAESEERTYKPPIEMCEQDGKYLLKAQLPGFSKDDIDVEIGEDSITIKAHTKHVKKEEKENLYRSEFRYGKYLRTIQLPSGIEGSDAKAEYKDGVLKITVPKAEEEIKKMKKLEIKD